MAYTYGRRHVQAGDEIVISAMEHHSNIVPWQMLCEEKQAILRIAPINERGELLLDEYEKLLNPRTKLVSMVHVSNALGTINPVAEIARMAHQHGVPVFIDGAQAVAHMQVDVQAARLRLLLPFRPQDVRTYRHRRPIRQGRAAE